MRKNKGWYKMDRGWMSDPVFKNNDQRIAYIWMIEHAAIQPMVISIKGNPVNIKRGQMSHSIRHMAEAICITKASMERILTHLKKWGKIKTENKTGQNVITICNYSVFQENQDRSGTEDGTGAGQERDRSETIIKNEKKEKNKKKEEARGGSVRSDEFEKFWDICPKKVDIGPTEAAYLVACEEVSHSDLFDAMQRYAAIVRAEEIPRLYIKTPSKWLKDKKYLDEEEAAQPVINVDEWPLWKQKLIRYQGEGRVNYLFESAVLEADTIYVLDEMRAGVIRRTYWQDIRVCLGGEYKIRLLSERLDTS